MYKRQCAIGGAWWGVDLAQTWGLREADGGVLKPLWQRVTLGAGLALLGVSFLAGMLVYLRFYIIGIDVEDEGQTVVIRRFAPFPVRRFPSAQVRISGTVNAGDPLTVTAPYDGMESGDVGSYLVWGPSTTEFFDAVASGRTPPAGLPRVLSLIHI